MGPLAGVHLASLGAAVSYGLSDVCGALAARRVAALWVTFWLQLVGLIVLLPAAVVSGETLSTRGLVAGGAAGVLIAGGLVAYFHAMTVSPIGLVSPIAAAVGVVIPVVIGVTVFAETLGVFQQVGVVSAVAAVVLVAYQRDAQARVNAHTTVVLSVVAGAGFGLFPVALRFAPETSNLWPLVAGRTTATFTVVLVLVAVKPAVTGRPPFLLLTAAGLLDVFAQGLFFAALRTGVLGVPAVLASLFPVVTVLAGRYLLKERLRPVQLGAVVLAFVAIIMIVADS